MDIEKAVWSFRNEKTEKQVDGLSYKQAAFVFTLIPRPSRFIWLVWHEGLTDWLSLDECTHFKDEKTDDAEPPPPPEKSVTKTKTGRTKTVTKSSKTQKTDIAKRETANNRRLNRRFAKHFKVTVDINGKQFVTHTMNVSMGGMLLEHPMPLEGAKTFPVKLERFDGTRVEMFCSMIRVPNGLNSKRLRIIGVRQEGVFRNWLLDPNPS